MTVRLACFLAGASVAFLGVAAWAAHFSRREISYRFGGNA